MAQRPIRQADGRDVASRSQRLWDHGMFYTTVGGALEVLQERSRDGPPTISFNVIARSSSVRPPLTAGGSQSQRIVTPLERLLRTIGVQSLVLLAPRAQRNRRPTTGGAPRASGLDTAFAGRRRTRAVPFRRARGRRRSAVITMTGSVAPPALNSRSSSSPDMPSNCMSSSRQSGRPGGNARNSSAEA